MDTGTPMSKRRAAKAARDAARAHEYEQRLLGGWEEEEMGVPPQETQCCPSYLQFQGSCWPLELEATGEQGAASSGEQVAASSAASGEQGAAPSGGQVASSSAPRAPVASNLQARGSTAARFERGAAVSYYWANWFDRITTEHVMPTTVGGKSGFSEPKSYPRVFVMLCVGLNVNAGHVT